MSEFSESVHALGAEVADTVASLEVAGATAVVLPKVGPHVTLLTGLTGIPKWSSKHDGTLLVWKFAQDHALDIALYAGGKRQAVIGRAFEADARWKLTHGEAWERLGGVPLLRLEALFAELSSPGADPHACAERMAGAFGLSDVDWVSARDLRDADGLDELRRRFPRATFLKNGKRARWTTEAQAATYERERHEFELACKERITGAPLLAPPPPPLRRGARRRPELPWDIKASGSIQLEVQNFGGEARGVFVELESELIVRDACTVVGVWLDGAPLLARPRDGKVLRFSTDAVSWPAAANPDVPTPVATRRLRVELKALAPDRARMLVRVVPGMSADGRGRLALGRLLQLVTLD